MQSIDHLRLKRRLIQVRSHNMQIELAYGRTGLMVDLPDEQTTVVEPKHLPGLPDVKSALINALRNPIDSLPLRQLVSPKQTVAISVCDITRPMPSSTVLPVLLEELRHVPKDQVFILIATGTHRANTDDELQEMLGADIVRDYAVINHSAFDSNDLVHIGDTDTGIPIWLNKFWVNADVRITTGFVEPHFFAGFSGGPKMVAPGLAGFDTIMGLHSAKLIANPKSTWAVTYGNPIHDAIRQIAEQSCVDFSIDVTINRERQITSSYAGELFAVHRAVCETARRNAMCPVHKPFDVVITTNSGFPLDMNLYQCVKGMSAGALVAREGGTIICAAECRDGLPDHGEYAKMLLLRDSPEELLKMVNSWQNGHHDQWQVQIQSQLLMRNEIYLKSGYLTPEQIRSAHFKPSDDIQVTIGDAIDKHGGTVASVCVLPQGPQTIPYIESI